MLNEITKTFRSLFTLSKSEIGIGKKQAHAPMTKHQKEKDDMVVDMMSAIF